MSTNPAGSAPVTVYLAAPEMQRLILQQMYPNFQDSARFQVVSMAQEWETLQREVRQYRPEVLVIDAGIAPDTDQLRAYLGQLVGTIAMVILPQAWAQTQGQFESLQSSVRGVYIAPPNWASIAGLTYSAVITERTRMQTASPASTYTAQAVGAPRGAMVIGTRTIAFTSFAGGTGKSTIAGAMAVELARNHIRTLLCSFNSPPAAVSHMGLNFEPNASEWLNRPTGEGFAASLQRPRGLDDLDVLIAPNDPHNLLKGQGRALEQPDSIRSLIYAANLSNYGAIILDLPPFGDTAWALHPLLVANMVLFVGRRTVHDAHATVRGYQLLTVQLAQQIMVPPEALFAVLNFASQDDNMSERDYQNVVQRVAGRALPIMATFPYASKLPSVQNRGDSPMLAAECDEFAKVARGLAGKLVGGTMLSPNSNGNGDGQKGKGLFGVSFKLTK